jgi:hypothetical protein
MGAAIKSLALELGFEACGFAEARPVDKAAAQAYVRWLDDGKNDCMAWAGNYLDLRFNPQLLFPGAKTVISLAMNYLPQRLLPSNAPQFARYAYGKDYHEIVRDKARDIAAFILEHTGHQCRVCVDSAPMLERYWAQQAGLGFVGLNGMLIIPRRGSFFFLCEILTTLALPPDEPCKLNCGSCRECERRCPGGALHDGVLDARRCLSCQTIENHDETLPQPVKQAMGNHIYGCDECQLCCPHNRHAQATSIAEFQPSDDFLNLTIDKILAMNRDEFNRVFRHSPVKRAKLTGVQRNAAIMKQNKIDSPCNNDKKSQS